MSVVEKGIFEAHEKMLAVLIDPDKFNVAEAGQFLRKIPHITTHIFIGGSSVEKGKTEACVKAIKAETRLPVVLFPGDHSHITPQADALLFLSLISGRNPEYLIGQQVKSAQKIRESRLEVIPTGYILVDGGTFSAVQRVSGTQPLSQLDPQIIVDTALAGQYSGKKLIYLEAGSGAKNVISEAVVSAVKEAIEIPLIVGGGIQTQEQLTGMYAAGADLVVIGTAFEKGEFFNAFEEIPANNLLKG
ncbi:MAG: geranylgeranylglyceryl/heptaprenylglyceryl phosphate synthase [Salinimicrobium sp.]